MTSKTDLIKRLNATDKLIRDKIGQMIGFFDGKLDQESGKKLRKIWDMVIIGSNISSPQMVNRLIGEETYVHFLKFEDMVKEKKIDELLEYDFSSHIIEGTASDTRELIENLSDGIKTIYINSDEVTKETLWESVVKLIKFSVMRANVVSKLEKM